MKFTRPQFGKKYKISNGNIANYITRGKLVEDDGKIDDKNPINEVFIEKRKLIPSRKGLKGKKTRIPTPDPKRDQRREDIWNLEKRKKEVDIDLKKQRARLDALKEGKLLGEYIPLHLAKHMFTTHFKNTHMAFKDGVDRYIVQLAAKWKINQNGIAEARKELVAMLNSTITRAEQMSEREIDTIDSNG